MSEPVAASEQVSVEQGDRILTGIGVSSEALAETMARHAPEPAAGTTPLDSASAPAAEGSPAAAGVKTRGAKRYDKLTWERESAERETAQIRQRAEAAERERDELKAQLAAAKPVAAPAPVTEPAKPDAPKKFAFQSYAEFLVDHPTADYEDDYLTAKMRALVQFEHQAAAPAVDLDAQIRASIEADRASRTLQDHVSRARDRGRQVYADFDAIVQAPHMLTAWDPGKLAYIARQPEVEHLQYQLGKDAALAERLRLMTDPVEFGMILASLQRSADRPVASPASTARRASTAPAPYQPVGSASRTTAPPSAELVKQAGYDYDRSGYGPRRAAERGVTSRR